MSTPASALQIFGAPAKRGGEPRAISSLHEWFDFAPPKGGLDQWVPLRSAYELAQAWCGNEGRIAAPEAFLKMLLRHPLLADLKLIEGYAEHATPLRGEGRGPRVHDLLLIGRCGKSRVVIGVEGKADEEFDRTLRKRWDEARRKRAANIATNWPARLERLAPALFGVAATTPDGDLNPEIQDVPYQLISALAGTLIEAEDRGASLAVVVVHVFSSSSTRSESLERNRRAFANFVARVATVSAEAVNDGEFFGPFSVPGGEATKIPSDIPVLIGELTTKLKTPSPAS